MWRIAAPMILSNVSVPLLGMVDTGVMGHLESPTYLGAVAIGGTIFTFLYIGMNFLRMGTTGIAVSYTHLTLPTTIELWRCRGAAGE